MSVFGLPTGYEETTQIILTTTNSTTVLTAPDEGVTITQIHVADASGSGDAITLEANDGSTAFYMAKGKTISANDVWTLSLDYQLKRGWTLKATAATEDRLHVHVTYLRTQSQ